LRLSRPWVKPSPMLAEAACRKVRRSMPRESTNGCAGRTGKGGEAVSRLAVFMKRPATERGCPRQPRNEQITQDAPGLFQDRSAGLRPAHSARFIQGSDAPADRYLCWCSGASVKSHRQPSDVDVMVPAWTRCPDGVRTSRCGRSRLISAV
jgi:hypothetical protein